MAGADTTQLRRDYFWNSASSLMFSASSVVMLLVVTRQLGLVEAGVYALATAIGQQLQTLGAYEVRPYQATDVRYRFSFGTYFATRIITVSLMTAGIVAYAMYSAKPGQGMLAVILIASIRVFDAFEDVFYSEFQREGRLDVAGKTNFFRVLATTLAFCAAVYLTSNLLVAALVTVITTLVAMLILVVPAAARMFSLKPLFTWAPIAKLLWACFPLFLAAFLATYLINAPRFAIEAYLDEEQQGIYAILFMPAFAINLLTMLVFRPLLTRLATAWNSSELRQFIQIVAKGLLSVLLASAATLVVTYVAGVPILDLLYDVDLAAYKHPLMILVVAGAFNAVGVILYYALATVRKQALVFTGYALAAVIAFVSSTTMVPSMGLLGAAYSFGLSMLALAAIFAVVLWIVASRVARDPRTSALGEGNR